jgi:hypothetical protein
LAKRAKTDPVKTAPAARIREETTVTIRWLARRLQMGTRPTLNATLYRRRKEHEQVNSIVRFDPCDGLTPVTYGLFKRKNRFPMGGVMVMLLVSLAAVMA